MWEQKLNFAGLERQYGLPRGALRAVMQAESAGNPKAVSPKGARGLFQFMPATAQEYGIDPFDPAQAAPAAAKMLGSLQKQFGSFDKALAGYNWGSGNLQKHGLQNAPAETRNYIQKITSMLGSENISVDGPNYTGSFALMDDLTPAEQEELKQLEAEFGDVSNDLTPEEQAELAQLEMEFAEQEQSGFFGRVGQDLQKRKGMIQEAATAYNTGKQSLPETYIQGILNGGAGFGSDLIGNAIGSVARTVDDATLGVAGKSLNSVLGAVADSPVGSLAKAGMAKYNQFAENNPRAARNIQAGGNLLGLATSFTPVKGVSAAGATGKALKAPAKAMGTDIAVALNQRGLSKFIRENSPRSAADLQRLGAQKYAVADQIGGTLNPKGVELLSNKAKEIGVQASMDKRLGYAPDAVDDIAERLQNLRGSTISLQELDQLDTRLRTIKNKNFISGDTDVAIKAEELQDFLREFRNGADPSLIDGGQEGFAAWKAGDEIWTQKYKLQQIEDILAYAENKLNKAQAIRTKAQTLLANKKKTGHWSPDERAALREMGKSGIADGVLGLLGGRLAAAVGLGAGNPVGALALHGVGIASRGGRDALQVGRAEKAAQTVLRKVSPPPSQLRAEFLSKKGIK